MPKKYDFIVIGGGSGGVRAARWSGGLGAKVAICEEDRYGGTCVVRGCIPKKLMVYASELPKEMEHMQAYGWSTQKPVLDWDLLKKNRDAEIDRLTGLYGGMLAKNGVDSYKGRAKIVAPNQVEVNGEVLEAEKILIATGGVPHLLDIPGIEHAISSNELFHLPQFPKNLAIVGAGFKPPKKLIFLLSISTLTSFCPPVSLESTFPS